MRSIGKIKRVFIANRGEIARRIALTAKRLGIETVALTDKRVPPAFLAGIVTDFLFIAEETTATYLNIALMIEYAKASGCDAIHPGFGFLSENAEFAEKVVANGLTWVGPRPGAIDAMASKATARQHAEKSGVPCLPGLNGLDLSKDETRSIDELTRFVSKVGFPVLMKAAYGGGGKGMRIVRESKDLIEQAKRAASEALSSFGNSSLIVEKYLDSPRHVEVQVLADKHSSVAIVGDRDCSLQRRHQKIIEEAPAPNIPAHVREAMHKAAYGLAMAVGYDNAGTVEFLLDESQPQGPTFYFLEMNTRLQVEHTVTEEVFGIDLVEWQFRVASGEALSAEVLNLKSKGHSIEVRIYAEDPGANFFPSPGPVRTFIPATGKGVRWELGLDVVDEISTRFDPMISKLVCTASDRVQAFELLAQTLERTQFSGPRNNIPFLIWLSRHPKVLARPVDTHFIAQNVEQAVKDEANERRQLESDVSELFDVIEGRKHPSLYRSVQESSSDWKSDSITRAAFAKGPSRISASSASIAVEIVSKSVAMNPADVRSISRYGQGLFRVAHGASQLFNFVNYQSPTSSETWIGVGGHNWVRVIERQSTDFSDAAGSSSGGALTAPVPGKVMAVSCGVGDVVVKGQVLFILESMKMQFEVKSAADGKIVSVKVDVGEQVASGHVLGVIEI